MEQPTFLRFERGRPEGKALRHWWRDLHGQLEEGDETTGAKAQPSVRTRARNYRGDRAELRRCAELTSVVLTPAYQRLFYALADIDAGRPRNHEERLATVAGVLARVDKYTGDGGATFARQLAQPRSLGGLPRLSELRFRRLLRIRDHSELYPFLVRLARLLDGAADLFSLAQGAYWWGVDGWGDAQRKRWAYEYYDAEFRQAGISPTAE